MILIAATRDIAHRLVGELREKGEEARALDIGLLHAEPAEWRELFEGVDALVLEISRHSLSAALVAACDASAVRVLPLVASDAATSLARAFGLGDCLPLGASGADVIALRQRAPERGSVVERGLVIAVWGPHGAPGRSTIARELAFSFAQRGVMAALVDADTIAPSQAVALGIPDEGPGFAAACRQAERGTLDAAELVRISATLGDGPASLSVLAGINRPSRWPELSSDRVGRALDACREWARVTVVDVAASIERDEEIVSDLDGPRRHAATIAVLEAADHIVAISSADAVGVARFLRGYSELKELVPATPMTVVVNRVRGAAGGFDPRNGIASTLRRFAGIEHVLFVPHDARSADAAILHASIAGARHPRRPLALAVARVARGIAPHDHDPRNRGPRGSEREESGTPRGSRVRPKPPRGRRRPSGRPHPAREGSSTGDELSGGERFSAKTGRARRRARPERDDRSPRRENLLPGDGEPTERSRRQVRGAPASRDTGPRERTQ